MDDGIFEAFNIPEQQIVEQVEDTFTIGDNGKTDKKPEEPWDPFA